VEKPLKFRSTEKVTSQGKKQGFQGPKWPFFERKRGKIAGVFEGVSRVEISK
jgi:hypothetical protein